MRFAAILENTEKTRPLKGRVFSYEALQKAVGSRAFQGCTSKRVWMQVLSDRE